MSLAGYLAAEAKINDQNRQIALQRNPSPSPFFNLDHIDNTPGSAGPQPGFIDSFKQAFQQQYRVDSPESLNMEIHDAWAPTLDVLRQRTGKDYRSQLIGDNALIYAAQLTGQSAPVDYAPSMMKETIDNFKKIDAEITAMNDPKLKTFKQVLDDVSKMQQNVEAKSGQYAQTQGTGGFIGTLLGGMAGSFTTRDPINLITLPVGGFGRSVATRIVTEMGAMAGISAITDWGFVNPHRQLAGLPERSVTTDALVSALGAGVLRGGGEAIAHVAGRMLADATPEVHDAAIKQVLEADGSPTARAGLDLLEHTQEIERASPYGDGHVGTQRFIAELQDVQRELGGTTDTAIARVLPPMPIEDLQRVADFEIVKEQAPEVWAKVEAAQTRVTAIDVRRTEINSAFENTNLPTAVGMVDKEAADKITIIEQRLAEPNVPEPERAALELERQAIVNRVGPDKIAKAVNDSEIKLHKELGTLRGKKQSANREYRLAIAEAERTRDALHRIQRLRTQREDRAAVDLLGNSMKGRSLVGPLLRHDVVERHATDVAALAETQGDRALTQVHALTSPDGKVDIGLKEPVDENFRFYVGENGKELSVRQVLDDLAEDEKLDEAMRSCLL